MADFFFIGRLSLDGVIFTVRAESVAEARRLAAPGAWDDYDIAGASSWDSQLDLSTIEADE